MAERLWTFVHLFFAFAFVGTLVLSDWNARAARATTDWARRGLLFGIVSRATRIAGTGALLFTGVAGNFLAVQLGYRMSQDRWLQWVNALWLAALAVQLLICLPSVRRLVEVSAAAAEGGPPVSWDRTLGRWRAGNALLSLLYLGMLVLMVFRWRG